MTAAAAVPATHRRPPSGRRAVSAASGHGSHLLQQQQMQLPGSQLSLLLHSESGSEVDGANYDSDVGPRDPADAYDEQEEDVVEAVTRVEEQVQQPRVLRAVWDFVACKDEQLTLRTGDRLLLQPDVPQPLPNWLHVSRLDDQRIVGFVPEAYVEDDDRSAHRAIHPSPSFVTRELQMSLSARAMPPTNRPRTHLDELRAAGAMPSGFRTSLLADLSRSPALRLSSAVRPHLDRSGVGFADLFLDPTSAAPRSCRARVSRIFTVVEARDVPLVGRAAGLALRNFHVRVVLFDKQHFLSNILTVRAVHSPPGVWKFNQGGALPSGQASDNTCVVRSSASAADLCLLFELCATVTKADSTQTEDMSCGWAKLPLFNHDGTLVAAHTYTLRLQGGTPFEAEVALGQSAGGMVGKRTSSSRLFGSTPKPAPRLVVQLSNLKKAAAVVCDFLPPDIVTLVSSVQLISLYRGCVADHVLKNKSLQLDLGPSSQPALAAFPAVADKPFLLHALSVLWNDTLKVLKKSQKKDQQSLRAWFQTVLLQKIWPLLHSNIPYADDGDIAAEKRRQEYIESIIRKDALEHLTSPLQPDCEHTPFSTNEVMLELLAE
eukprot:m.239221 g.239221  ORF g.239221 m.239221 type:complete len:603 (+) comp22516_c1_seq2:1284-3092(+)